MRLPHFVSAALVAGAATGAGVENQRAKELERLNKERADVRQKIPNMPEIEGNDAIFHLYGTPQVTQEFDAHFRDHATAWALQHGAQLVHEWGSNNLMGSADISLRYRLPREGAPGERADD